MPLLTVIICTYNRDFILRECLRSLKEQTAAPEEFNILIVNNNSSDTTENIVNVFCKNSSNAQTFFEPRQGLSHARNRGLAVAQSDWVAFLDDDAKAPPQWVNIILKTITRDDFDCFGGPYRAWHYLAPPPAWFVSEWESTTTIFQQHYGLMAPGKFPTGGTCAMHRKLTLKLGGFPTGKGMTGKKCAYGEETALFQKMLQTGYRIGFVPGMVIDHCVLPYKYSLKWRLKSAYAHGRDDVDLFTYSPPGRRRLCLFLLIKIGKELFWRIPKRLRYCIQQKFLWQRTVLECLSPLAVILGKLRTALCCPAALRTETKNL